MAAIIDITSENFAAEVTASDKPVLIDFWAVWCGPCQMVLPIIEELGNELTDVKICKVNVDEQPELAQQFNVMSIPTLLVFKNGQLYKSSVGAQPKTSILALFD